MKQRIIIAGGSGFLGRLLAEKLSARNYDIVVLTRSLRNDTKPIRQLRWDGRTLADWAAALDGALAVVNLAGRSVNCRYHTRNRREILESRVNSTRVLGEAIERCSKPPRVWLNASTATIYKHTFGPAWDETGEIGGTPEAKDEFSVEVARAWERAFFSEGTAATVGEASRLSLTSKDGDRRDACPTVRKVALRMAMVLGAEKGSVFPVLRRLVRFGLGGKMGSGEQYVSWIHEEDFCRAIEWLIDHDDGSGPVNVAAPNPIPNREMMRTLRAVCRAQFGQPATRWMLEVGAFFLRTETELIIKSRRVVPERLLNAGFEFRFSKMEDAMREIESRIHS